MLTAKRKLSGKIDVQSKKPMIRQNTATREMVAGFLNPVTGEFEVACKISKESDIDAFLEEYDLSVVMISKM
jgi:hypothetical protein